MGRAGIRRRKPAHHLPKVEEHYDDAEVARVFGQFRWSAYTPAGSVERAGFLARQASRRRRHPEWQHANRKLVATGWALMFFAYLALAVVMVAALLELL